MTQWDRTTEPTEEDLVRAWIEHHVEQVHTALPCRVQRYDAATQTADLVPLVRFPRRDADGGVTHEDIPVLPCVPVLFPRTADHFIAFAVAPGDMGLVVFSELAIGHWRVGNGDVTDPGDLTRHGLSHGVFLPGLFHRGAKLAHAPAGSGTGGALQSADAAIVVGSDSTGLRITIKASGALEITQGDTLVAQCVSGVWTFGGTAGAQFAALANLVDARLSSIRTWLNSHQHVETGGTTNAPSTPLPALDSVAATKLKAV